MSRGDFLYKNHFQIKKNINKRYKAIELDLDGVYRRLLLLKKKKYVGLAVDLSTGKLKREAKGLDIIRRDWSGLAKEIGMLVFAFAVFFMLLFVLFNGDFVVDGIYLSLWYVHVFFCILECMRRRYYCKRTVKPTFSGRLLTLFCLILTNRKWWERSMKLLVPLGKV